MPGDFLGRMAQEIDGVELLPQASCGVGEGEEAQAHRFGLALGNDAVRFRRFALRDVVLGLE
jgi:hypothetical protein